MNPNLQAALMSFLFDFNAADPIEVAAPTPSSNGKKMLLLLCG